MHFTVPGTMLQILLLQRLAEVTHKSEVSQSNKAKSFINKDFSVLPASYLSFTNGLVKNSGRDSAVGIATRYGLDGPEFETRSGVVFCTPSPDRP